MRAAVSLWGDFSVHPDEVFQYLEPAHGLVFGNSVEYWEFFYGGRSWLVPGTVAAVLWVCAALGLGEPVYYIAAVKLFFCVVSLAIPFSMYAIGRRLFGELSGRLALVLGAFWFELVGYAHKPMTEFLATPLLLFLIVLAIGPGSSRRAAALGVVAVLVVAVRFHYAVPVAALGFIALLRSSASERLAMIVAGLAAVAAVGLFEFLTWGAWFHSYWLNFNLNLIWNVFREDESSWFQYLAWLSLASTGAVLFAAAGSVWNLRRRWLLLALAILIVFPHMLQPHKEYRFVFAAIPLWLVLFADILATGLNGKVQDAFSGISKNYWSKAGLSWAAAASLLGLLNAIPLQKHLSVAYSNEIGRINYLRDQDPTFEAYRKLSSDPNFRGVLDISRNYFNTGGYYYLHRRVPFYQSAALRKIDGISAENLRSYVSHVVATGANEVGRIGRLRDDEGTAVLEIDGKFRILPAILHRGETGKLAFVGKEGGSVDLEGYELTADWGDLTLWSSIDRESPVREWKEYKVYPDSESRKGTMKSILGERTPPSVPNYGIQFAD